MVMYQGGDDLNDDLGGMMPALSSFGLGDLRISPKVQILYAEDSGVHLAVVPTVIVPTGGSEHFLGEDGLAFAPEVVASRAQGALRTTASLGYHARPNTSFADLDVRDEIFVRLGAGYRLHDLLALPLEVDATLSAATAAGSPLSSYNQNHLDLMVGASYELTGPFTALAAGGAGLRNGFGTPDWRVLAGARVHMGRDRDQADSVLDRALAEAEPTPAPDPAEEPPAEEPQFITIEGCEITPLETIQFEVDSARLTGRGSFDVLRDVAAFLREHPEIEVFEVQGHTDNTGTRAHNQELSEQRAQAVVEWLVNQGGIDRARLRSIGFGQDRPKAPDATREDNRRVEFSVVEGPTDCVAPQ